MSLEMVFVSAILLGAVYFFVSGRLSPDIVSVLIILSLVFSGLLTVDEAFSGFSSPVIIIIASFFVISGALYHTEVAGLIGKRLSSVSGSSETTAVTVVMISGVLLSSIMTNLAATAILLPGVISVSVKSGIAPSRLLMPLAYGTILGGMFTVVGTQPNIIVASVLLSAENRELGFFSFLPFGAVMAVAGLACMLTIGRRLLPVRKFEEHIRNLTSPELLPSIYRLEERLFELKVPKDSSIAGKSLAESSLGSGFGLNVIGIMRSTSSRITPHRDDRISVRDRLLVQGREEDVNRASETFGLEIKRKSSFQQNDFMSEEIGVAEAVLPPRSQYFGKKLKDIYLRERFGITVLAIWRGGKPIRARLGEEILELGDALLLRGAWNKLSMLSRTDEFFMVSGVEPSSNPQHRDRMFTSIIITALMLAIVITRIIPVSVAVFSAAALMILTGCLTVTEAYRSVEWRAIILMAGIIPLGDAMVKTGLIEVFVSSVFYPFAGFGTLFMTAMLYFISCAASLLTSNITSAILLSPVALSVAGQFNISPELMLITVALGASNGFMTPVAQQANLIVMGPGYYTFRDYIKAGSGLSFLVFAAFMLSVFLFARA